MNHPTARAPLIFAELDESDLGDQVTLYTDWDKQGTNFPVTYLSGVITALQGVQNKLGGIMATELPQGFEFDNDYPPDEFTRGLGPAFGDEGQPGAVESIWTPDRGIVLEVTTNDDGELTIDQARQAHANLGRVLEALNDLGH